MGSHEPSLVPYPVSVPQPVPFPRSTRTLHVVAPIRSHVHVQAVPGSGAVSIVPVAAVPVGQLVFGFASPI